MGLQALGMAGKSAMWVSMLEAAGDDDDEVEPYESLKRASREP